MSGHRARMSRESGWEAGDKRGAKNLLAALVRGGGDFGAEDPSTAAATLSADNCAFLFFLFLLEEGPAWGWFSLKARSKLLSPPATHA